MKINEIFKTIQGEATFTGTPSIFIRLQGCPVWCSWCDTKFTWHTGKKSKLTSIENILSKDKQDDRYCDITEEELLKIVDTFNCNHIVITGGEPFIQDLSKLFNLFKKYSIQVETSCTQLIECPSNIWITGSPKINMAGNQKISAISIKRANEIKFPILNEDDVKNLLELIDLYNIQVPIWLQPVDINGKKENSLGLCLDTCYKYNFRLSIQTHKYIGLK